MLKELGVRCGKTPATTFITENFTFYCKVNKKLYAKKFKKRILAKCQQKHVFWVANAFN